MLFMCVRQIVVVVFYIVLCLLLGLLGKKKNQNGTGTDWNSGLGNSTSGSMPSRTVIIRVIDL